MTTLTSQKQPKLAWLKVLGRRTPIQVGDRVKVSIRYPVGHYRVPRYVRGKHAIVESVIKPAAVNNEEEGFGRNAGLKRHYYRVAIPPSALWIGYTGAVKDSLRIEVYETWLEPI